MNEESQPMQAEAIQTKEGESMIAKDTIELLRLKSGILNQARRRPLCFSLKKPLLLRFRSIVLGLKFSDVPVLRILCTC
jgi:hypothetical protein